MDVGPHKITRIYWGEPGTEENCYRVPYEVGKYTVEKKVYIYENGEYEIPDFGKERKKAETCR